MAPTMSPLFLAEVTNENDDALLQDKPFLTYPGHSNKLSSNNQQNSQQYKWDIVWRNVFGMIYLHTFAFYGIYLFFAVVQWKTAFFGKQNSKYLR